ncbi:DUF6756 family protein [Kroppenstedtia eburnea]|uniref:DUF6756 family protein n=1 Tax=Kroppenstedtia eburnea TaxID=714067 RepID=UPI00362968EA
MDRFSLRAQVIEAAETHHIQYVEIPPKEMNQIRNQVLEKFVAPEGRKSRFFWEYMLPPRVSVHNEEGWRWMGEFVDESEVILFFEDTREEYGFQLFSGPDLVEIVGEMTLCEIYLTDPEFSYLLVHNHHDFLLSSEFPNGYPNTKRLNTIGNPVQGANNQQEWTYP